MTLEQQSKTTEILSNARKKKNPKEYMQQGSEPNLKNKRH